MSESVFEVTQEADGGYCAECLTVEIFTQGDSWDELRKNVREAVRGYFFDGPVPDSIRLHLVRDEMLATHIIIETTEPSQQRIAGHSSLRIGTLNSILRAVSRHKGVSREEILKTR
ncbi:MAG TPA: hypothetical protein VGG72_09435 [Bryobacteraceae bacterium]